MIENLLQIFFDVNIQGIYYYALEEINIKNYSLFLVVRDQQSSEQ